jgi:hypothetical protein
MCTSFDKLHLLPTAIQQKTLQYVQFYPFLEDINKMAIEYVWERLRKASPYWHSNNPDLYFDHRDWLEFWESIPVSLYKQYFLMEYALIELVNRDIREVKLPDYRHRMGCYDVLVYRGVNDDFEQRFMDANAGKEFELEFYADEDGNWGNTLLVGLKRYRLFGVWRTWY